MKRILTSHIFKIQKQKMIQQDISKHGGRQYKLFDKFGKRIGSLDENGRIIAK